MSSAKMSSTNKTVLCIDDEAFGLSVRKLLLESSGFRVVTAAGGEEGLAVFKSQPIDAVVVDYQMPGMDGGVVSAHIKQLKPRIPVIILTGYPSVAEDVSMADAFMQKADEPTFLVSRLESLVRIRSHSHPELEEEYVVFADSSRRYLDCSDGVCQLLGYPRMELLNMTIDDVSYHSDRVPFIFEQYVKQGKLDGQYILKHRTGKAVFILYRAHVFSDGCMAAIWNPVEDWKQLYQSAMLECEPNKLKERVEIAHTAIQERLRELTAGNDRNAEEWHALEDALTGLKVLSKEFEVKPRGGNSELI